MQSPTYHMHVLYRGHVLYRRHLEVDTFRVDKFGVQKYLQNFSGSFEKKIQFLSSSETRAHTVKHPPPGSVQPSQNKNKSCLFGCRNCPEVVFTAGGRHIKVRGACARSGTACLDPFLLPEYSHGTHSTTPCRIRIRYGRTYQLLVKCDVLSCHFRCFPPVLCSSFSFFLFFFLLKFLLGSCLLFFFVSAPLYVLLIASLAYLECIFFSFLIENCFLIRMGGVRSQRMVAKRSDENLGSPSFPGAAGCKGKKKTDRARNSEITCQSYQSLIIDLNLNTRQKGASMPVKSELGRLR